jgi:hypothetical protein
MTLERERVEAPPEPLARSERAPRRARSIKVARRAYMIGDGARICRPGGVLPRHHWHARQARLTSCRTAVLLHRPPSLSPPLPWKMRLRSERASIGGRPRDPSAGSTPSTGCGTPKRPRERRFFATQRRPRWPVAHAATVRRRRRGAVARDPHPQHRHLRVTRLARAVARGVPRSCGITETGASGTTWDREARAGGTSSG